VKEKTLLNIPSMKPHCTPEEWQARVDLAACYRLVDLYGMSDMMANHISSHVPGEHGAFLINPYGMMYEEITASSLIKVNLAGEVLARPDFGALDYSINRAGYVIHSAVHAARPDVACVIHTHAWASMAVSALECGLLPITQTAMRFLKIRYHTYQGVVLDDAEKAALVEDLATARRWSCATTARWSSAGQWARRSTGHTGWNSPAAASSRPWRRTRHSCMCLRRCSRRPGTTTSAARAGLTA